MMDPSTPNLCPECGKPVPADSQHQICPACLMAQALASRTIDVSPATAVPPPTPEEIAGKFPQFEILECLGRGGMGVVYKARQKSLNRLVAIKILAPERVHEARFAERFAREAELLAQLSHPHIVTIHDFGETDGLFYLVMEFVDGVNLRDLMRDGKLAAKQALAIVPPICEALQYAHDKRIVHRDIKPENLLLDRDGRLKIADFGIAALAGAGGEAAGTPPYMAPEQCGAFAEVDSRADIYALGVVLYEMLTGERPAKEVVAPSKKVQLDVRIDEMVLKALEKTPELRYQTAGEFRTVVETMAASPASVDIQPETDRPGDTGTGSNAESISSNSLFATQDAVPSRRVGMLRRFWWLFLVMIPLSVLLGLGGGSIYCYVVPKRYESNTKIEVLPYDDETGHNLSFIPKEIAVIVSSEALNEVVRRLDLGQRWKLDRDATAQHLRSMITVGQIRGTDLLSIRAISTDAGEACDIANNLADTYRVRANADFHAFNENAVPSSKPFGVLSKAMNASRDRVYIHADAVVSSKPVAPSVPLVLAIAALAGLILSPLLALLVMRLLQRRMIRRERLEGAPEAIPRPVPTAQPAEPAGSTTATELAEARKWVAAPAIGLMVVAAFNLLLAGGLLPVLLLHFGRTLHIPTPALKPTEEFMRMWNLIALLGVPIFVACPSLLTFLGAWRMRNLKGYGLAVTAAILAIITPPGMLVGLAFGIWALIVLARRDVQEAFRRKKSSSSGKGCVIACFALIGVVLPVILTVIGLRMMRSRHALVTSFAIPSAVVAVSPGNPGSKTADANGLKPIPPEALRALEEFDRWNQSLTPQDRLSDEIRKNERS